MEKLKKIRYLSYVRRGLGIGVCLSVLRHNFRLRIWHAHSTNNTIRMTPSPKFVLFDCVYANDLLFDFIITPGTVFTHHILDFILLLMQSEN